MAPTPSPRNRWVVSGSSMLPTSTPLWNGVARRPSPARVPSRHVRSRVSETLEEVFRREAGACVATLIRILGDIDLAEDAVAEAFAIAAEKWSAIPPNPGGWITTTARNRAIDRLRRESSRHERHLAALRIQDTDMKPDQNPVLDELIDVVPDDQLR